MTTREVTLYATSFGTDVGPFNITDNFSNTVALGVTTQQILSSIVLTVDDTADTLFLTSIGRCTNTFQVPINAVAPSPSVTPSTTASPSATPSVTPSISISRTATPSVSISTSPTPSITITPSRTATVSITPSITPSTSISATPSITPSITPTVTPSTSPIGINSCPSFLGNNIYLKVNWFSSGSINTPSGVYDRYGNYCGDNVEDYAYVVVEFYSNPSLTNPVNLSNIRINGVSDGTTTLGYQEVGLSADSGLSAGILTSGQSSVTFNNIIIQGYYPDNTQTGECTSTNYYAGIRLTFGCSSVSNVTVQQNNTIS